MSLALSSTSKIRLGPSIAIPPFKMRFGEREKEGGAATDSGVGPDPSAVANDDTLDCGQANAGTLKFVGMMKTLEHAKKLVRVLHVETHAIIAHEQHRLAVLFAITANLDLGWVAWPGVFDGVGE